MKKIVLFLFAYLLTSGVILAQNAFQKSKDKPKSAISTTKNPVLQKAAVNINSSGVPLKADGTPDKRYKQTKTKGPLKKDGMKDMRYKVNKK